MPTKRDSMSFQSQIGKGLLLSVFLLTQTVSVAQAQTADPNTTNVGANGSGASSVIGAIGGIAANFGQTLPQMYQQNPQQLFLTAQQQQLTNKLAACQAQANGTVTTSSTAVNTGNNALAGLKKMYEDMQSKEKAKRSSGKTTTAANSCTCTEWPTETELSCPGGFTSSEQSNRSSIYTDDVEAFKKKAEGYRAEVTDALTCYQKIKDSPDCPKGKKELVNAQKAMNCMMDAMNEASNAASQALSQALSSNQAQYAKMNQYQGEVAEQIAQVEGILGPDPKLGDASTEFKGLLGLQAEMTKQLMDAKEGEANFEEALGQVDKDQLANDQTLEAERMQVVASCLKGDSTAASGGQALMCPKPVTRKGADGKDEFVTLANGQAKMVNTPCGPLDYIRSRIKYKSMMDNGHYMDRNGTRVSKSDNLAASYDGTIDAIMREMGSYEQATQEGRVESGVHGWADIQKNNQIMSKLQALDSDPYLKGVNIVDNLRRATEKCGSDSSRWKAQQMASGASRYSKEKLRVDNARKKLNSQLDNGLSDLNRSYKNAMSLLSDQQVALDRYSCKKDSKQMMQCYKDIRQNLNDLLDGNGRTGFTSKLIKGGTMVGGFTVPCRGINGCVTALKTVRDRQKDHIALAQKTKMKFVTDGNNAVQNQLQSFAQVLQVGSRAIQAHFANMKNALGELGVTTMPKLNMLQGATLKQSMNGNGEQKEPGPYEMPENMAAVLSGMSGGIPDPADSGTDGVLSAANEKFTEKTKAVEDKIAELKKMSSSFSVGKVDACFSNMHKVARGGDDTDKVKITPDACNGVGGQLASVLRNETLPTEGKLNSFLEGLALTIKSINPNSVLKVQGQEWDKLSKGAQQDIGMILAGGCEDQVKHLRVAADGSFTTDTDFGK